MMFDERFNLKQSTRIKEGGRLKNSKNSIKYIGSIHSKHFLKKAYSIYIVLYNLGFTKAEDFKP